MDSLIRAATPQDIPAVAGLINSAYRGEGSKIGWTTEADMLDGQRTDPETLAEIISDRKNVILLVFHSDGLVACVHLRRRKESAYLGLLTVSPVRQSAGIGKRLLHESEQWIKNVWHMKTVEIRVIGKRSELIAWYERRGYRLSGQKEPFPYGDERFGIPKVDDLEFVVMAKSL